MKVGQDKEGMVELSEAMKAAGEEIHALAKEKGWWDNPTEFGTSVALMHSELSEAIEADRMNAESDKIPGFSGVEEELADLIIRVLDVAEHYGFKIGEAIEAKHEYNAQRAWRHGGKRY